MSLFNRFEIHPDYIVLTNLTCCQHNVNNVKRSHIIAVEMTRNYSIPWLLFGCLLIILSIAPMVSALGLIIVIYQVISIFSPVILIRVSGHNYFSTFCCDQTNYGIINSWFVAQQYYIYPPQPPQQSQSQNYQPLTNTTSV